MTRRLLSVDPEEIRFMAAQRHRQENDPTGAQQHGRHVLLRKVAAPAALLTVAAVVVIGGHQLSQRPASQAVDLSAGARAATTQARPAPSNQERLRAVSRSASRSLVAKRVTLQPRAVAHRYATAPLNIWTRPGEQGPRLGLVPWGTRVAVTGQRVGHWAEVLLPGKDKATHVRWVNATYLVAKKPVIPSSPTGSTGTSSGASSGGPTTTAPASGVTMAPCPDGSAVESGLTAGAIRVYRSVCAAFPALTTYGGYRPDGEHADGKAVDFMINGDSALGQAIANWVQAHAAELDIYDIIWQQHIWTPVRASEGWRWMPDRGSPTANHYDHVHVAVN